jgi:hypothetical protein
MKGKLAHTIVAVSLPIISITSAADRPVASAFVR